MAQRRPTLVLIAGPNGSGKTTLARTLRARAWFQDFTYINPDQIAQDEFGDWNAAEARSRAALRAANLTANSLRSRASFAIETVLSASGVRLIERAKAAGYLTRLHFVATRDPRINVARVADRVARHGHDIPTPTIVRRYHEAIETLPAALALADHATVYDNSEADQPMRRLFRTEAGRLAHLHATDLPEWATPARQRLAAGEPER
ncbi:MAG: zeta toxin family protein [Hyphomicrobiaceae bacterium]